MSATQIRFHFNEQTFARAPFICCLVNCISDKMSLLGMGGMGMGMGMGFRKLILNTQTRVTKAVSRG